MSEYGHNLFEQLSDEPFTSAGIRPGGLELTRRGLVHARLAPGDAALDIGCGTGVTMTFLREHSIQALGIDSSAALLDQARARNPGLLLLQGEGEALPFADQSFDAVLLECVLSLVQDRSRVLRECHRVLGPEGRIIVTDVYARNSDAVSELRCISIHSCLRGALDKDLFFQEWSTAGFSSICFEDHSGLLRDFAVRMIWHYGSLDPFWRRVGNCGTESGDIHSAVRKIRPGYFLFVGNKQIACSNSTGGS